MATIKMHHHRKQQGLVDNDQDELPVLAGITVLPRISSFNPMFNQ
jgi:hypothetical protein